VRWYVSLATLLLGAAALGACDESAFQKKPQPVASAAAPAPSASAAAPSAAAEKAAIDPADLAFFKPLPERFDSDKNPITEAKVKLGRLLYYEPRFSIGQDLSCNSCHELTKYGVDNEPTSFGHKKQRGARNSPTVYNAAGYVAQFWDGRAATVEDQAKGPILNPVEMAMPNEAFVLKVLKSIPEYGTSFKEAFPKDKDPISYDNVANAIGAFERQLVTPGRWDKFLRGDQGAITEAEKAGFAKFAKLGCPTCHNGATIGGAQFQKLGLVNPYPDQSDLGRYVVTKNESDKMFFRVPSLRNVEKTAPYFHNGSIPTLELAVKTMAHHQLGMELKPDEIASIVTWLKCLTGELPMAYVAKPELPASTDKTPKAKLD
jgi:cytochrome c peroxidase